MINHVDGQSSPSHRLRHHHNRLLAALTSRSTIFILLVISFVLGYLSRSHPLLSPSSDDILHLTTFSQRCTAPVAPPQVRPTILHRVFNNSSPWHAFPPSHAKPLLFQQWTKGWGSTTPVFDHLLRQTRPKIIIEVGTFLGASAIHMTGLLKTLGLDESIILCIDDFRGWPGYYDGDKSVKMVNGNSFLLYQFMQNVVTANATEPILFLPFSAATALGGLCEWGVYGDLIEIDAAHDFHSAWVDINNAYKVLRPGGVLFGHDYKWDGVRRAVHLFARRNGFRVKLDGEHWVLY